MTTVRRQCHQRVGEVTDPNTSELVISAWRYIARVARTYEQSQMWEVRRVPRIGMPKRACWVMITVRRQCHQLVGEVTDPNTLELVISAWRHIARVARTYEPSQMWEVRRVPRIGMPKRTCWVMTLVRRQCHQRVGEVRDPNTLELVISAWRHIARVARTYEPSQMWEVRRVSRIGMPKRTCWVMTTVRRQCHQRVGEVTDPTRWSS